MIKLERKCTYCGATVEGWTEDDRIEFRTEDKENLFSDKIYRTFARGDLTISLGRVKWKSPHPVPAHYGSLWNEERMCVG